AKSGSAPIQDSPTPSAGAAGHAGGEDVAGVGEAGSVAKQAGAAEPGSQQRPAAASTPGAGAADATDVRSGLPGARPSRPGPQPGGPQQETSTLAAAALARELTGAGFASPGFASTRLSGSDVTRQASGSASSDASPAAAPSSHSAPPSSGSAGGAG